MGISQIILADSRREIIMRLLNFFGLFTIALAYPKGNAICDGGRRMMCKWCGDACGQSKCPPDPVPAEYPVDEFPQCQWGCYCEEGFVWSTYHAACLEGEWEKVCFGPNYYTLQVIPEYRSPYIGWRKVPNYKGGYSRGGYRKKKKK